MTLGVNICFLFSDQKVPTELKKAIMQARQDKKLTQSQLAQVTLSLSLSYALIFFVINIAIYI